ncbi:hypothetical protein CYMTET_7037 [Cymbomonas tetramitiformis]|uniref:Fe2OG dioxygenase domain-containing protein n=1 Tax=Cymbomonas tetramitiformis TaxID=36881 RepID=A0AAE0GW12_9CHLO|nr:hypothetical protein CYMTET_7037 [Cymbomonas tetramitiformis]
MRLTTTQQRKKDGFLPRSPLEALYSNDSQIERFLKYCVKNKVAFSAEVNDVEREIEACNQKTLREAALSSLRSEACKSIKPSALNGMATAGSRSEELLRKVAGDAGNSVDFTAQEHLTFSDLSFSSDRTVVNAVASCGAESRLKSFIKRGVHGLREENRLFDGFLELSKSLAERSEEQDEQLHKREEELTTRKAHLQDLRETWTRDLQRRNPVKPHKQGLLKKYLALSVEFNEKQFKHYEDMHSFKEMQRDFLAYEKDVTKSAGPESGKNVRKLQTDVYNEYMARREQYLSQNEALLVGLNKNAAELQTLEGKWDELIQDYLKTLYLVRSQVYSRDKRESKALQEYMTDVQRFIEFSRLQIRQTRTADDVIERIKGIKGKICGWLEKEEGGLTIEDLEDETPEVESIPEVPAAVEAALTELATVLHGLQQIREGRARESELVQSFGSKYATLITFDQICRRAYKSFVDFEASRVADELICQEERMEKERKAAAEAKKAKQKEKAAKRAAEEAAEQARLAQLAALEEERLERAKQEVEQRARVQREQEEKKARHQRERLEQVERREREAQQQEERELRQALAESRRAEEAKLAEQAARAEEAQRVEAAKLAEEAERAEAAELAEEAQRVEAAKLAEEAQRVEAAELAEQAARAEEAQRVERLSLLRRPSRAEAAKLAEEAERAERAEEAERAEAAKLAEARQPAGKAEVEGTSSGKLRGQKRGKSTYQAPAPGASGKSAPQAAAPGDSGRGAPQTPAPGASGKTEARSANTEASWSKATARHASGECVGTEAAIVGPHAQAESKSSELTAPAPASQAPVAAAAAHFPDGGGQSGSGSTCSEPGEMQPMLAAMIAGTANPDPALNAYMAAERARALSEMRLVAKARVDAAYVAIEATIPTTDGALTPEEVEAHRMRVLSLSFEDACMQCIEAEFAYCCGHMQLLSCPANSHFHQEVSVLQQKWAAAQHRAMLAEEKLQCFARMAAQGAPAAAAAPVPSPAGPPQSAAEGDAEKGVTPEGASLSMEDTASHEAADSGVAEPARGSSPASVLELAGGDGGKEARPRRTRSKSNRKHRQGMGERPAVVDGAVKARLDVDEIRAGKTGQGKEGSNDAGNSGCHGGSSVEGEAATINILGGLVLHTEVFSENLQRAAVEMVEGLLERGRRGELQRTTLRSCTKGTPAVLQVGECVTSKEDVNEFPAVLKELVQHLLKREILPPAPVPNTAVVHIFEPGDSLPATQLESHIFRPAVVLSFLSSAEFCLGAVIEDAGDGQFTAPFRLRLDAGSVLVLQGPAADIAHHSVPAVSQRRISILLCHRPVLAEG